MNSQDNPIFVSNLTKWDVFKATWLVFFLNLIYVPQKSRFKRFFIHIILKNKYNISSKNINSAGILDLDTAIFINTKKMYIISSFKDSNLNNHHQKVIIKIISKSQNNTVLKKTKLFLTIKNRCKYYFRF